MNSFLYWSHIWELLEKVITTNSDPSAATAIPFVLNPTYLCTVKQSSKMVTCRCLNVFSLPSLVQVTEFQWVELSFKFLRNFREELL